MNHSPENEHSVINYFSKHLKSVSPFSSFPIKHTHTSLASLKYFKQQQIILTMCFKVFFFFVLLLLI